MKRENYKRKKSYVLSLEILGKETTQNEKLGEMFTQKN